MPAAINCVNVSLESEGNADKSSADSVHEGLKGLIGRYDDVDINSLSIDAAFEGEEASVFLQSAAAVMKCANGEGSKSRSRFFSHTKKHSGSAAPSIAKGSAPLVIGKTKLV